MRDTRTSAFATVAAGALAAGFLAGNATGACATRRFCTGVRLPAPITVTIGRVSFGITQDGRVRRVPQPRGPFPRDAAWFPGTGAWFVVRRGHLVVGRGRDRLWRSRGTFPSRLRIGVIAVGTHAVAFSYGNTLYLAPLSAAERPIARAEFPLGWSSGGLYTYRYPGRRLLLRSDTGAILKTIARRPLQYDYDQASGSLYFLTSRTLMRAQGAHTQQLARLARLGLSANQASLQPLGRLLALQSDHRLVVLRADGSTFARTPLPLGHGSSENISGSPVTAPDASAVAFTAASGQTANPAAARRSRGTETVYVLRFGSHTAIPTHREHVQFAPCERGVSLEWHGRWLLYSASEGNLAVIDTTGVHQATDLSSRVSRLTGTRSGFSAYWSGQPTEP